MASPQPWALNDDLTMSILDRVGTEDILEHARKVCEAWSKVSESPYLFRVLDLRKKEQRDENFEEFCRQAVDPSDGKLIDVSITDHGESNLLNYITNRSPLLRRLKLQNYDIDGRVLAKSVENLTELEELHLIMASPLCREVIEKIGRRCPKLETFTYHEALDVNMEDSDPNGHASAIAASMPNLKRLRLIADPVDNKGLEAVLAGCPKLECLDIRRCSSIDLKGQLGKRLQELKVTLKLPSDGIEDLVELGWEFGASSSLSDNSDVDAE